MAGAIKGGGDGRDYGNLSPANPLTPPLVPGGAAQAVSAAYVFGAPTGGGAITAVLAVADASDTLAAVGDVDIAASLAASDDADALGALGAAVIAAALGTVDAEDALVALGNASPPLPPPSAGVGAIPRPRRAPMPALELVLEEEEALFITDAI